VGCVTELATLRILWPTRLRTASSFAMVIEVDGREIGRLRKGQDLVTYVEPGRHILRARAAGKVSKSEPVELVLAPGEDVRLETRLYTKNFWDLLKTFSIVRTDVAAGTPTAPPVDPPTAQVLGITEMHRSEESIGTESRRIGNTSGAVRLTRTMRVTREWSRTVNLDLHDTRGSSADTGVGPAWLFLRATVEQSLSRAYTISEDRREEFAEELSVEVEPGAAVTVVLDWKRLWQHGVVHALFQGRQIEIPFCVAIGITFDQSVL
jgi:hypothetical protein